MSDGKRYDGAKILSEVSGIPVEEVRQAWSDAVENQKRLSSCRMHTFVEETRDRFRCAACGGTAGKMAVYWYNLGVQHERAP